MGFTMPEEDENLFVSTMISPALILACPFVKELPELRLQIPCLNALKKLESFL